MTVNHKLSCSRKTDFDNMYVIYTHGTVYVVTYMLKIHTFLNQIRFKIIFFFLCKTDKTLTGEIIIEYPF